jgi:hypothetical protein
MMRYAAYRNQEMGIRRMQVGCEGDRIVEGVIAGIESILERDGSIIINGSGL